MGKLGAIFGILLGFIIIFGSLASAEVSVREKAINPVVIAELGNPGVFEFEFSNTGEADNAQIYTTIGVDLIPRSGIDLPTGKNTIEVKVYPSEKLKKESGNYFIEYFVKGNFGVKRETFQLDVVRLEDAIIIMPSELKVKDDSVSIIVRNVRKAEIGNVRAIFSSPFFSAVREFSLGANDQIEISIPVDTKEVSGLNAGSYVVTVDLEVQGNKARVDGVLDYVESQETTKSSALNGLLIRTSKVTKINEGNIPVVETIAIDKGVIGRLFTTHSIDPDRTERDGLVMHYEWDKQLQPGESWEIRSSTNYTIPFLLALVIVLIGFFTYNYTTTNVVVMKRVSPVRTKGGEFALKVHLSIKTRKSVENIKLIDKIPGITKLFEGGGKPHQIEHDKRRLIWNIMSLRAGEEKVFSYVIYSKINVVGKFELPVASAHYDLGGKREIVYSNRALFLSDRARSSED